MNSFKNQDFEKEATPKLSRVRAFLKIKGWQLSDTTDKYFIFTPPLEIKG